jgi:tetratricopeptide (TPR) repeat protein
MMAVAALAVTYLSVKRVEIPEDCQIAVSALEEEDYNRAIDHYLLCLDAGELPTEIRAGVYYGLGIAESAKGDHDQAIEDYSEVIHLIPTHGWAYNNRCWSYGRLHHPREALADCDEALRLLPDQPAILDSRALAYWLLDEKDKAREDLERAHQLDPSNPTWETRFREFEEMF